LGGLATGQISPLRDDVDWFIAGCDAAELEGWTMVYKNEETIMNKLRGHNCLKINRIIKLQSLFCANGKMHQHHWWEDNYLSLYEHEQFFLHNSSSNSMHPLFNQCTQHYRFNKQINGKEAYNLKCYSYARVKTEVTSMQMYARSLRANSKNKSPLGHKDI
jgi:hypothetical protein